MVNKTKMVKKEETQHEWFIVDAKDAVLGRLSTRLAVLLCGKNRVDYTPNVDNGAGIIVLNCNKIRVTGKKAEAKFYQSFSGYPGGLKKVAYKDMIVKKPDYILRHAVKGMLPKNKLASGMLKRLKLYVGSEHPHSAQNPKQIEI